jgi:hypothetical protein
MKKYLFVPYLILLSIVFCYSCLFTQTPDEKGNQSTTKVGLFLASKGKLLIKQFYEIGKVTGSYGTNIKFDALLLFEPGQEDQRIRGIKITIKSEDKHGEKESTSFLDMDEMESLSKAIDYALNLIEKWKNITSEYTEVIFCTRDDFKVGFYQKGTEQTCFSSSGYVSKVSCFFPSTDCLKEIKEIINKGIALLVTK